MKIHSLQNGNSAAFTELLVKKVKCSVIASFEHGKIQVVHTNVFQQ